MSATPANDPLRTTDHDLNAAPPAPDVITECTTVLSVVDGGTGDNVLAQDKEPKNSATVEGVKIDSVPGYEIESVLGRGSMGVVYKARHLTLKRTVALKLIFAGGHAGPRELTRFRIEAEAVARLQHPNIVQIHEVGAADGQPYCALEFVEGGNLASKLDGKPMPAQEAAKLVEALARAMQLAHSRNVVHRDLKPANILLAADGTPKISDFGLARQLDSDSGETQAGAVMGTPSYMAPEQASGHAHEAGPAADVYALGAILYDCLTGQPPFRGKTIVETLDQVRTQEPVAPSRARADVPLDLETICLKCLRKEPENRYASAAELADELVRYQKGEPILARPVGLVERAWRWCRRNPAGAAVYLLGLLCLAGVVVVPVVLAVNESHNAKQLAGEQQRTLEALALANANEKNAVRLADDMAQLARQEKAERVRADLQTAQLLHLRGHILCEQGEISLGMHWLARSLERLVGIEEVGLDADLRLQARNLKHAVRLDLALCARDLHELRDMLAHRGSVLAVAFSPDGKHALTGGSGFGVNVWDVAKGTPLGEPLPQPGEVRSLAFSANGRMVLTAANQDGKGIVRLWDLATRQPLGPSLESASPVQCTALHPDGKTVLVGRDDGKAQLWDGVAGQLLGTPVAHIGSPSVRAVAFSPDGAYFATGCWDNSGICRWNTATRQQVGPVLRGGKITALAFRHDGKAILTGGEDQTARLWNPDSGAELLPPMRHQGLISAVAFSPDGGLALVTDQDQTARLWDLVTGLPRGNPLRHAGRVHAAAFNPDGQSFLTGEEDGAARLWRLAPGLQFGSALRANSQVHAAGYSRDGTTIAAGDTSGAVFLWDVATSKLRQPALKHGKWITAVAFRPDGGGVLVGDGRDDGFVGQWDPATGQRFGPKPISVPVKDLAWSPDGKTFLTANWSYYGRWPGVALGAQRWDAATHAPIGPLLKHGDDVWAVCYSADGKTILTAGGDRTARLWDAATGQPLGEPLVHPFEVWSAVFSLDGKLVLTGCRDRLARVWDVATGRLTGKTMPHPSEIRTVAFSPDGGLILTGCRDGYARLWDFQTRRPLGLPLPQMGVVERVAFAPGGQQFLTAGRDGTVRQWTVPPPVTGDPKQVRAWVEAITGGVLDQNDAFQVVDAAEWRKRRGITRLQRLQETSRLPAVPASNVIAHISSEQSMPKRTLFCTLGLLALAVAGFLIIPLAWAPRITPESYDKVKEGMQLADVEAILGPPQMRQFRVAWHYDMRTVERLHADFSPEREVAEAIRWQDRGGMIIVGFIASGEVAFKLFDPVPEASFADKLRRCMLRI